MAAILGALLTTDISAVLTTGVMTISSSSILLVISGSGVGLMTRALLAKMFLSVSVNIPRTNIACVSPLAKSPILNGFVKDSHVVPPSNEISGFEISGTYCRRRAWSSIIDNNIIHNHITNFNWIS